MEADRPMEDFGASLHAPVYMRRRRESGQAAVETALTMPLTLFMVLGSLQLFMLLQGRLMAEHAVYKAVRSGVVNHGDCTAMTHAAVAALLPSFTSFLGPGSGAPTPGQAMAEAFRLRTQGKLDDNRYDLSKDAPHDRAIVWIYRESPRKGDVTPESENDFDDPDFSAPRNGYGSRLEVKMVYWYPLRIPFANWVISAMFRAYFGFESYTAQNPLMATQRAQWNRHQSSNNFRPTIANEYTKRTALKQYTFPITVSYAMHMMTPPRTRFFASQNCPGAL
jgi:hypothetical protein